MYVYTKRLSLKSCSLMLSPGKDDVTSVMLNLTLAVDVLTSRTTKVSRAKYLRRRASFVFMPCLSRNES